MARAEKIKPTHEESTHEGPAAPPPQTVSVGRIVMFYPEPHWTDAEQPRAAIVTKIVDRNAQIVNLQPFGATLADARQCPPVVENVPHAPGDVPRGAACWQWPPRV